MIAEPDDPRLGSMIGRRLPRCRAARLGDGPPVRAGEGDDLGILDFVPWLLARFMPRRPLVTAWATVAMLVVALRAAVTPLAAAMIATPCVTPVR